MYKCPKCNQSELVNKYVLPGVCLLCAHRDELIRVVQELLRKDDVVYSSNRRAYSRF
jgi:hypothetical protein